jgi:hypothetical protein
VVTGRLLSGPDALPPLALPMLSTLHRGSLTFRFPSYCQPVGSRNPTSAPDNGQIIHNNEAIGCSVEAGTRAGVGLQRSDSFLFNVITKLAGLRG